MSPLQALLQSLVHSKPSSAFRGMLKASPDVHLQKFAMPLATEKDLISTSRRSLATKSNYYAKGTYMDKDLVTQRVLEMVKAVQKVDPHKVSPTARFSRDLGLDSLDTVELLMGLEVEFGLEIPNREADKFVCSADAINFIASHPRTVASKPKPSHS